MSIGDKGKYKLDDNTEYLCQIISTHKDEEGTTHYYASIFGLGECVEVDSDNFSPLQ